MPADHASSLPPSVVVASLTDCPYQTYPAAFYVGMGLLLGLLIGYGFFRWDAAAWWRAYRRVKKAEEKDTPKKED